MYNMYMRHPQTNNLGFETQPLNSPDFQETNPAGDKSVLLIGGMTEGIATLQPLADALAATNFRVVSFDQTAKPEASDTYAIKRHHAAKSRQAGEILEAIQSDSGDKVSLVAHSQGADFALDAALEHPDKIERIILFNTEGLFSDSLPRLAGRFALESVRKSVTMKQTAQRQQVEGIKRIARHPRDSMGDAIDVSHGSIEDKLRYLQELGIQVDLVLSAKDQVFPWRLQKGYFESQNSDKYDFNGVSSHYNVKPSGKPHKLASKWAGHDNSIIYPEQTAKLVSQLVRGQ